MLRASRARPGDAFCPSVLRKQKLHQPGYPPKKQARLDFCGFIITAAFHTAPSQQSAPSVQH